MNLNQSINVTVYRAWNKLRQHYQQFYNDADCGEYSIDFLRKENLQKAIEEDAHNLNDFEIHAIEIVTKRIE